MNTGNERGDQVKSAIESFWKVIPPFWHYTRNNIHRMAYEKYGVTTTQYHVLRRIHEGSKSVSDLSTCMFVSRPNISRAVEELVNAGWAERERDSNDRRSVALYLTDKGHALLGQMKVENDRFMQNMFSYLDNEELKTLTSAFNSLEKILANNDLA